MSQRQIVLWGFLGFVGLAMVAGAIAVLFPRTRVSDEILFSLILIGLYALGVMLVMTFGSKMPWTRLGCILGLVVSLVFFLIGIWFDRAMGWRLENMIYVSGAIALTIGCGLVHRLFIWPIKPSKIGAVVLKWSAVVFAVFTTGVVLYGFIADGFGYWGRVHIRTVGISSILTAGTTIATVAIAIFRPKLLIDGPGMLATSMPVLVTCPRCQSGVEVKSNRESRCGGCRLKIRVEVEEPRCGCGYLLYELESDVCPECGKAVADEDRWTRTV